MDTSNSLKALVQDKYGAIAAQSRESNVNSCCGATVAGDAAIMAESYATLPGYVADADLGLGCGLPTQFAHIEPGHTVLDLGSGAGNDCFVARAETGDSGKVIGVDFTPAMIAKARANAEKLGYNNVEFRQGDIEDLPVSDNSIDVVVSNCVLNLVPDKARVFREIQRVLKPGGHFSISDIVLVGQLPDAFVQNAELYAGCVSGALQLDDYLGHIEAAGFVNAQVQKKKPILLPDSVLLEHFAEDKVREFLASGAGIFSITVYAEKAGGAEKKPRAEKAKLPLVVIGQSSCCEPGSGCC